MCHQRLAEGEAPACVQACPTEAIRIIKAPDLLANTHSSLLGDISITRPTNRYIGREVPASATAADRSSLLPQHAHWPLVLMLMLTQAGIGLMLASRSNVPLTLAAAGLLFAGMGASVFHLGQPLKAWRFFLGLRTSWLSREILAFSLFAPLPAALVALAFLPMLTLPPVIAPWVPFFSQIVAVSLLVMGLLAVFTSVMIYHDTRRALWRFPLGAARFFGTVASFAGLGNLITAPGPTAWLSFGLIVILKMMPEARLLKLAEDPDAPWSPDTHSARLQLGPLGSFLRARFVFGFLAACVALVHPWAALPILLISELLERQLFFQSVHSPKMPGNFGPENAR